MNKHIYYNLIDRASNFEVDFLVRIFLSGLSLIVCFDLQKQVDNPLD